MNEPIETDSEGNPLLLSDIISSEDTIVDDIYEKDAKIILDVGGDDDGAIALGRYKQFFDKADYEMSLVVMYPVTLDMKSLRLLI